jgi:hypothetical protein
MFRPLLGHHKADLRTLKVSYKIWLFMPDGIPCGFFLPCPDRPTNGPLHQPYGYSQHFHIPFFEYLF